MDPPHYIFFTTPSTQVKSNQCTPCTQICLPRTFNYCVPLCGGVNSNAIRRLYLRGLGINNPATPSADGTRKWEYLGEISPALPVYPDCATLPYNRNKIMIQG
jgi:hypothetical protein